MRFLRVLRRTWLAGVVALLAFTAGFSLPGTARAGGPAVGYDDFAIEQFYDELAPHGEWVYHPVHGYVWLPRAVGPDWRPFTVGNWIYTNEYGWYWDSYEPFAWAVYHYGRWGFDPAYNWYWVPGDTWSPAWVQWRYGDEYVGWAPEPPRAYGGGAYGAPVHYSPVPPERSWVFVRPRYLTSPVVRSYAVPRTSISIALSFSKHVYRPEYRGGHVYNYGMPRKRWSRLTRQRIEPLKIHRGRSKARPRAGSGRSSGDLYVYAPRVKKGARPKRPPRNVNQARTRANANTGRIQTNPARARGARPNPNKPRALGSPAAGKPNIAGPRPRARAPQARPGGKRPHNANAPMPRPNKRATAKPGGPKTGNGAKAKRGPKKPSNANASKHKPNAKAANVQPGRKNGNGPKAKSGQKKPGAKAPASKPKPKPASAKPKPKPKAASAKPKPKPKPKPKAAVKPKPKPKAAAKPKPKPKPKPKAAGKPKPKPKAAAKPKPKAAAKPRPKPKPKAASAKPRPKPKPKPKSAKSRKGGGKRG